MSDFYPTLLEVKKAIEAENKELALELLNPVIEEAEEFVPIASFSYGNLEMADVDSEVSGYFSRNDIVNIAEAMGDALVESGDYWQALEDALDGYEAQE